MVDQSYAVDAVYILPDAVDTILSSIPCMLW